MNIFISSKQILHTLLFSSRQRPATGSYTFIPESMLKHTSTTMALTRDLQNQIEIDLTQNAPSTLANSTNTLCALWGALFQTEVLHTTKQGGCT